MEGKKLDHQEINGNNAVELAINGGHIENSGNFGNVGGVQHFSVCPPELDQVLKDHEEDSLRVFRIPLLTKEQVLRFDPAREIPDPKAHSGDYPDHTLAPLPMRLREYGTDLRAMIVFNSLMSPLLNAGDAAIFQATGWNDDGVYVYRVSGELHISRVRYNRGEYVLTKEFKPEEEIPCRAESFEPIGRVRAVLKEIK